MFWKIRQKKERKLKIIYIYVDLFYGKLHKLSRQTKSRAGIGYPSGKIKALVPSRDCPFCSRNITLRRTPRGCTKVFIRKIFSVTVKIF